MTAISACTRSVDRARSLVLSRLHRPGYDESSAWPEGLVAGKSPGYLHSRTQVLYIGPCIGGGAMEGSATRPGVGADEA